MIKNILSTALFITSHLIYAQSPGGVTGANRWYKADAGVTTGATMTWADQSGSAINVTQGTAANQPAYNTTTGLINFNPKITFDGTNDRLSNATGGVAFGTGAYTIYYVASNTATATVPRWVLGTGTSAALNGFNSGLNTAVSSKVSGGTTFVTQTNAWTFGIPNITRTGFNGGATQPYYISSNGAAENTSTNVSPNISTTPFTIGARPDGTANFWQGDIAEAIIYSGKHVAADFDRVQSYLAIKYGISLAGNYLSSTGTTVWNSTTNAGYLNNIAGIARNDASGLYQKQSISQNTGNHVIIGAGTSLSNTNALNSNTLSDGQFLIWGDNGAARTLTTALSHPTAPGGEINYIFPATWKVQNTSSTGTVTVAWPAITGVQNFHLIRSSDATFTSADDFISMTSVVTINGVDYNTATITFNSGDFFTFGGYVQVPGGVMANLRIWLKADQGFTPASWTDYSLQGNNYTQTNTPRQPIAVTATTKTNFNPTVDFGTTTDGRFMVVPNGRPYSANGINSSIFMSLRKKTNSATFQDYLGFGGTTTTATLTNANLPVLTNYTSNEAILYPYVGATPLQPQSADGYHHIIDASYTIGSTPIKYGLDGLDGNNSAQSVAAGNSLTANGSILGSQPELAAADMQEVIAYERDLSSAEKQRVRSYLAIKYGTTLAQPQNYLNSSAGIIWNSTTNTGYLNNIAGIGRDNFSGLYQKQSNSVNTGDQILIGVGNSLSNTNAANLNTLNEGQFLIWGDNGLDKKLSVALSHPTAPGGEVNNRFAAIWRVQNTNTVGTVTVAWPVTTNLSNPHLVRSTDATFTIADDFYSMSSLVTINGVQYNTIQQLLH